jgi:hypothetical protein
MKQYNVSQFKCVYISGYVDGKADYPPVDESGSTYFPPIVKPHGKPIKYRESVWLTLIPAGT